jgi:hypothetical protein
MARYRIGQQRTSISIAMFDMIAFILLFVNGERG